MKNKQIISIDNILNGMRSALEQLTEDQDIVDVEFNLTPAYLRDPFDQTSALLVKFKSIPKVDNEP